jgi:DNA-binding Lrp family transcriptional regulator
MKLSKREREVLYELLLNGRASDQEIAKEIGTSRPTVAKIRKRLEEEGIIISYHPVIDYEKIDLHINAITMFRWKDYSSKKELEHVTNYITQCKEVILFLRGEGMQKSKVLVSVHKDLKSYEEFIRALKVILKDDADDVESFLSSIDSIHKRYN